jgi:putative flavoprotein involved in K+ transport
MWSSSAATGWASFPGWGYDGTDPDGFMGRDEIAARVARYAEVVRAPVALATAAAADPPGGRGRAASSCRSGRPDAYPVATGDATSSAGSRRSSGMARRTG